MNCTGTQLHSNPMTMAGHDDDDYEKTNRKK